MAKMAKMKLTATTPKRSATVKSQEKPQEARQTPNVSYVHEALQPLLGLWCMIRDCIEGETAVKGMYGFGGNTVSYDRYSMLNGGEYAPQIDIFKAKRYLPQPNPSDLSEDNQERYRAYVTRAVFYNVTGRTVDGMSGQIFMRDPVVEVPDLLKPLLDDMDGNGLNLIQGSKRAVRNTMSYARCGILVDYPTRNKSTSLKELQDGDVRPTITLYFPWNVINWKTKKRGGKHVLSLVVLREVKDDESDEFQTTQQESYRVLRLDPVTDDYTIQFYNAGDNNSITAGEVLTPKDAKGKSLKDIPFQFIGSENNDVTLDKSPIADLASLNIAHYRNSADYEEACFQLGQPTPVCTGLTEDWVNKVLKGTITLGSRAFVPLPQNADAKLLQPQPNIMPREAMKDKEEQMVALGAKLVQRNRATRATATEVVVETTSESSTLTNIAKNVSAAFTWAIGVAADFVGAAKDKIKFQLNTDFDLTKLSPENQLSIIKMWQNGAMTWEEMRANLRKSEIAFLPDAEAKTKVEEEQAKMVALTGSFLGDFKTPDAGGGNGKPNPKPGPNGNPKPAGAGAAGAGA